MADITIEEVSAAVTFTADEIFELSDVEVETLRRAALARSLPFEATRRSYSRQELAKYGMVREGYTTEELRKVGFGSGEVSCFDSSAKAQNSPDDPGGGLRIVTKGKIFYKGREYGPGDWFFVPNGIPYAFTTDPDGPTIVMYKYRFFGDEKENRFSHPDEASDNY